MSNPPAGAQVDYSSVVGRRPTPYDSCRIQTAAAI